MGRVEPRAGPGDSIFAFILLSLGGAGHGKAHPECTRCASRKAFRWGGGVRGWRGSEAASAKRRAHLTACVRHPIRFGVEGLGFRVSV